MNARPFLFPCLVAAGLLAGRGSLRGAAPPATGWEYRAVLFEARPQTPTTDVHTRQLEELARDGWEYVGPLGGLQPIGGGNSYTSSPSVAFRRRRG